MGEYPVYDDYLYGEMADDAVRNARFAAALLDAVPGRTELEIGTGAQALWARACIAAGAKRVHAIEIDPAAFASARGVLQRLGLIDRIALILGNSLEIELEERAEVCVSELIGNIGSAEGACAVLADARRRLLQPDAAMIPHRCVSRIAAIALPEHLHRDPGFAPPAMPYVERLLRMFAGPRDLRLCLRNLAASDLCSGNGIFEAIQFQGEIATEQRRDIALEITRSGRVDGFLLWIELQCAPGSAPIDSFRMATNWRPAFFPVFYPGLAVAAGDRITAGCETLLSDDGIHPDYRISGRVRRRDRSEATFRYESSHHGAASVAGSPFHRRLFP